MSAITKTAAILFIGLMSMLTLYIGRSLLIPFILALLIWFLISEILIRLEKIAIIEKFIPGWLRTALVVGVLFGLIGLAGQILSRNIQSLIGSYKLYEQNLGTIGKQLNALAGRDAMAYITSFFGDLNFGKILGDVVNSVSGILGSGFLIIIYVVFIFAEETFFQPKLRALCRDDEQYNAIRKLLSRIGSTMTHYVGLKTLISLITGLASYFILLFIGIQSPAFWAFLIFALNFIPNIGSLIATAFPAIFALFQFGTLWPAFLILVLVGVVQVLVGNFLEPKLMGNQLNISPLITILALSFWGVLWGITGMLLSVPITVMMIIIFSQFYTTRPLAILLSKSGDIESAELKVEIPSIINADTSGSAP
jgi:AI-2 transport protein TqsA